VFAHGYTYSAHPVCAAVALETLRIYEDTKIVDHVRRIAPKFLDGVRRFSDHPLVGEVRGVGLMAGIELVKNKQTKESFDPKLGVGAAFMRHALERGMIVRAIGDTVALSPPLVITEAETADMLSRLEKTLEDTTAWIGTQRQTA